VITLVPLIVAAFALSAPSHAAEQKQQQWDGRPKPLSGEYQVYGGSLSEPLPPTRTDRKVSFRLKGPLAKELFNQIGPDTKDACSDASDYRERRKGDLSCTYTKDDGHACYFGLDVATGKGTYGSIC
jgi:hypothetical protein